MECLRKGTCLKPWYLLTCIVAWHCCHKENQGEHQQVQDVEFGMCAYWRTHLLLPQERSGGGGGGNPLSRRHCIGTISSKNSYLPPLPQSPCLSCQILVNQKLVWLRKHLLDTFQFQNVKRQIGAGITASVKQYCLSQSTNCWRFWHKKCLLYTSDLVFCQFWFCNLDFFNVLICGKKLLLQVIRQLREWISSDNTKWLFLHNSCVFLYIAPHLGPIRSFFANSKPEMPLNISPKICHKY